MLVPPIQMYKSCADRSFLVNADPLNAMRFRNLYKLQRLLPRAQNVDCKTL